VSGDPLEVALSAGHLTDGRILGGRVNGQDIHWDCAVEAEFLTRDWSAFYQFRNTGKHDLVCDRCGNRMIEGKAST
jgi:hypothetical protein